MEKDDNLTFDKAFQIASQVELVTEEIFENKRLEEINFIKKRKFDKPNSFNKHQGYWQQPN